VEISKFIVGWLSDKTVENIRAQKAMKHSAAAATIQYIRYREEWIRTPSAHGRSHRLRINNRRDFRALYHRRVSAVLFAYFPGSLKVNYLPHLHKTITARTRHDALLQRRTAGK